MNGPIFFKSTNIFIISYIIHLALFIICVNICFIQPITIIKIPSSKIVLVSEHILQSPIFNLSVSCHISKWIFWRQLIFLSNLDAHFLDGYRLLINSSYISRTRKPHCHYCTDSLGPEMCPHIFRLSVYIFHTSLFACPNTGTYSQWFNTWHGSCGEPVKAGEGAITISNQWE